MMSRDYLPSLQTGPDTTADIDMVIQSEPTPIGVVSSNSDGREPSWMHEPPLRLQVVPSTPWSIETNGWAVPPL
jgi:hypothetical protein